MDVLQIASDEIKRHEGFSSSHPSRNRPFPLPIALPDSQIVYPYKDSTGTVTVGYGNTMFQGRKPVMGEKFTKEQLIKEHLYELQMKLDFINKNNKVPLNKYQLAALADFTYQFGRTALKESTLWKKIQSQSPDAEIIAEFRKWINHRVNGVLKPSDHIKKRRESNIKLWLTK